MKFVVVFSALLALSAAQFSGFGSTRQPIRPTVAAPRPQVINRANSDETANILRYDNDASPDGSYNYVFETDNGISAQAQGTPRDFGGNPPIVPVVAQGSYSYTAPDGQPIAISYIADENGYQPSGDALPTPPPIPAEILRSLEYLAKNAKA